MRGSLNIASLGLLQSGSRRAMNIASLGLLRSSNVAPPELPDGRGGVFLSSPKAISQDIWNAILGKPDDAEMLLASDNDFMLFLQ